jgi:hypothetical protein
MPFLLGFDGNAGGAANDRVTVAELDGTPGAANHRPWLSSSYLDFGVEVDHAVRRQNKSGRELLALHQVAAPEPEPL